MDLKAERTRIENELLRMQNLATNAMRRVGQLEGALELLSRLEGNGAAAAPPAPVEAKAE